MDPLVNPPPCFPPFAGPWGYDNNVITLWPQNHMEQQEFEAPPFKKPRTSHEAPLVPQQNNSSALLALPPNRPMNPASIPLRNTNTLFFKTRLCQKFRIGSCPYGNMCNFAHGLEELRRPPPNWQEIVSDERGASVEQQRLQNNKICRKFYNGEVCLYGDRCTYQHVKRETAAVNMGDETAAEPGANGSRSHHSVNIVGFSSPGVGNESSQRPGFLKTKICHKWEATGHCPYGDKCIFAHGCAELKKFGGHVESDQVNVGAAQAKHIPTLTNAAVPIKAEPTFAIQDQKKKAFPNWVGTKKISCIYADWLDDLMPFGRSSPTKAEACI